MKIRSIFCTFFRNIQFVFLLFLSFYSLSAQSFTYSVVDSLFSLSLQTHQLTIDSLPTLSLSPKSYKLYINELQDKQLNHLTDFALQYSLVDSLKNLLLAKITCQNITNLMQHPLNNGLFEVQQNEDFDETIKTFYRESYKDYNVFLDTIEVNNDSYLAVNEYIIFLEQYLDYQEIRFHVFNQAEKCNLLDRYWLIRLLFVGKVRKFMANKELAHLEEIYEENSLKAIRKAHQLGVRSEK